MCFILQRRHRYGLNGELSHDCQERSSSTIRFGYNSDTMMKLTKIVTLLVVSVALMNQVKAQDLSQKESGEEAYGASDRGVGFRKYPLLITSQILFFVPFLSNFTFTYSLSFISNPVKISGPQQNA